MQQKSKAVSLMHPVRLAIYVHICQNPGMSVSDIGRELSLEDGTLTHHINTLDDLQLIQSLKFKGKRIYYPYLLYNKSVSQMYSILRLTKTQQILLHIRDNPKTYLTQIAGDIGIHTDTVRTNLQRLVQVNLITSEKTGRQVGYSLSNLGGSIFLAPVWNISDNFVQFLNEKLSEEGIRTEVNDYTDMSLSMRLEHENLPTQYLHIELKPFRPYL